jgi:hypothetical protein
MRLKKLPLLNSKKKESFDFNLPSDYVTSKFYELGYKVTHNKASGKYNSCCPICREGASWGRKKRCWYSPEDGNISCYNCGSNLSTYNWIREVSGITHKELCNDLEEGDFGYIDSLFEEEAPKLIVNTLPIDSINLFDQNQVNYYKDNWKVQYALNYLKERRLDTAINRPDALYISLKDKFQDDRLVIPFKDESGDIAFFQTRRLFESDERPVYLSKLNADKTLYGIDKVNPNLDSVFLFEGPIDSFFVQNGLGVAGINKAKGFTLTKTQKDQMESLKLFKKIWCLDSQWLDQTAREKTLSLLQSGECVFIWPEKWGKKYKDLNELCGDKGLDQISPEWLKKNSTCGKGAVLKFKMLLSITR